MRKTYFSELNSHEKILQNKYINCFGRRRRRNKGKKGVKKVKRNIFIKS